MLRLRKLALVALVGCTSMWAQSASSPEPPGNSTNQSQTSQTAPAQTTPARPTSGSDKATATNQTPAPGPGDSTKLEPIKVEKAVYPWQAQQKELQGEVWVKIQVNETGDVENVEVISGDPILADAAVHAVKKWKFKPFIKNGQPIKTSAKVPFDFTFSGKVMEKGVSADGSTTAGQPASPPPSSPSAPTTPTAATSSSSPNRVRVSSGVSQGLLIHQVAPVYPSEARQARIQGVVVLQALISKEGRITELKVISGAKELTAAAIGAVQQWRYRPYLLMGEPVAVETQIQVNFTLRY